MNSTLALGQRTRSTALSPLEGTTVGILLAMVLVWTTFQIVEIRALFPPIGTLWALGSAVIATVIVLGHRSWSPALAAGWAVLVMIPESIPAIGHLTDRSEIYTHFGHYLVIATFFPLALALVATGTLATIQNRQHAPDNRPAPAWLPRAAAGTVSLIVIANAAVVALYLLDIP